MRFSCCGKVGNRHVPGGVKVSGRAVSLLPLKAGGSRAQWQKSLLCSGPTETDGLNSG